MRGIPFSRFEPDIKGTVAEQLLTATNALLTQNRKVKIKWLLASFFSMASLEQIEEGIHFEFIQMPRESVVKIQGRAIPIYDNVEGLLYKSLFQSFMVDDYIFQAGGRQLLNAIQSMKKYYQPSLKCNSQWWGLHTLRLWRMYALLHDYGVSKTSIKKLFKLKSWTLSDDTDIEVEENLKKAHPIVKLSESVV